jgi:cytochrome c oxidase subunit III
METILTSAEEKRITREKVAKPMLYLGMGSMVMLFAAFTSAYVVRQQKGDWLLFEMPRIFYISTAVILLSSVTMNWALFSAKNNDFKNIKLALMITLLLGVAFVVCQWMGWSTLYSQKIVFAGKYSNASGSFFYVLTLMHLLHLFGGMIALSVVWIKSIQEKYYVDKGALEEIKILKGRLEFLKHEELEQVSEHLKQLETAANANLLGIRLCAIFWHFLDLLWIYLFLFLLFVR